MPRYELTWRGLAHRERVERDRDVACGAWVSLPRRNQGCESQLLHLFPPHSISTCVDVPCSVSRVPKRVESQLDCPAERRNAKGTHPPRSSVFSLRACAFVRQHASLRISATTCLWHASEERDRQVDSLDEDVVEAKLSLELDRCRHPRQAGSHHDAVRANGHPSASAHSDTERKLFWGRREGRGSGAPGVVFPIIAG